MSTPAAFDLLGPLPTGTTVLEASAGTGKTYTIAGLVARFIAEGKATMDELLVVTFGRAATRELRERVRERLVSARELLADAAAARAGKDDVVALLATAGDAEVAERRRRLDVALSAFDAATVATTHGFCQQVLTGLGTAGDHDSTAVLVESIDDLVVEVAEDLYLRQWGRDNADPPVVSRDDALKLARAAVGDPATRLTPHDAPRDSDPDVRYRYARAVQAEVERRKRALRLLSYDDLLTRLSAILADPGCGDAAAGRLRARYRIVLVDEFQDTDPVQWDILRLAFHGHATLVLIGDPKQAIYAFRGADVHSYLHAADVAGERSTLPKNWRSDPALLDGLAAVLRGAALGDERIRVTPVAPAHTGRSLRRPVEKAPVRLRVIPRDGHELTGRGTIKAPADSESVVADLTAEIVDLLSSGATVVPRDGGEERPVEPGDIAVLVRNNKQADAVHRSLLDADVPAVVTGTRSVFSTPAAEDWRVLLEALEQPHRTGRVRRLGLSSFVGWPVDQLDTADIDALSLRVRHWIGVLEQRGVAALYESIAASERVAARLLSLEDGERLLTDLRHVAEALHEAALLGSLGLSALLAWLRRRIAEAGTDGTQERSRRLESDAEAVQVVTVHTGKGLEFPVVHVAFGWYCWSPAPVAPTFHDGRERVRDVGGDEAPNWKEHVKAHKKEESGEELRLLYVALTRAQSELVIWWAPAWYTDSSPLHRLLLGPDPSDLSGSVRIPTSDDNVLAAFRALAAPTGGALAVEVAALRSPVTWKQFFGQLKRLSPAVFDRSVDLSWRRTSYTALTAAGHDAGPAVGSEPEQAQKTDEPDAPIVVQAPPDDDALCAVPSPMADLPGGPGFGTLVHEVLQRVDPTAGDLAAEVQRVAAERLRRTSWSITPAELAAALIPSLTTPLGPLCADLRLSDLPPSDRLPELDFELPLAGGDRPVVERALLGDVAPLLRRHLPAGTLLSSYADVLERPTLARAPLRGYLAGSIDAVLRVAGPRYVVVDYKTNRLAPSDEPLTAWHYRPAALEQAMIASDYPLQALLYSVALHRYLRWRQPGYEPDVHLGGVLYLFLRGMAGPTAEPAGVFSWRPPSALVVELSDLVAGAAT